MADTTCTKGECILNKPDGEPCASEKTQELLRRFLVEKVMPKVKSNISKRDAIKILKETTSKHNESCLLRDQSFQDFLETDEKKIVKKELEERFKQPGHIKTPNPLSDSQIYGVLKRWRKEFPELVISEYAMSDFDKQGDMYDFARKSMPIILKNGYTKYACVLNTDVTDNGGKHWVAVYSEIKDKPASDKGACAQFERDCSDFQPGDHCKELKKQCDRECFIEYFDSLGRAPMDSVVDWASKNKAEMELALKIPTHFRFSRVKHQKENMECGVYCLYFIRKMVEGTDPEFFRSEGRTISDRKMEEFRAYVFAES